MRRRSVLALLCCLCVAAPVVGAGVTASTSTGHASISTASSLASTPGNGTPNACVGTMKRSANGITVVSVQGMRFGEEGGKRNARLVALGPRGQIEWVHQRDDVVWGYDVDPLGDGELFVTATTNVRDGDGQGETLFYKLDADTGEVVWEETTQFLDTHDADLLNDEEILVANMRATQNVSGNRDRLLVYNRTTDEITWQWQFRDHYDRDANIGEEYGEDWTHVNDVDAINDTHYLASPRNFDMVVLVNRTSGDVVWELGEPNSGDVMLKQHNPAYYESEDGNPTVLVADSDNDRIVEYERQNGEWTRTWRVGNRSVFSWPRDADRLPNGNTLVGDSANNRVVEVTPEGEVVWEVYTPWLVYDVERVAYGDEAGGPTIADQDAEGTVNLHGGQAFNASQQERCDATLKNATRFEDIEGDSGGGNIVDDVFGGGDGNNAGDGNGNGYQNDGWVIPIFGVVGPLAIGVLLLVTFVVALAFAYRRFKVPGED